MTAEQDALTRLVQLLQFLDIPYMVTGSFASSFHGKPRTTHDADIVIDPDPEALDRLVGNLVAAGFYVDLDTARDALRRRRQFNAIETGTAFKLDLIIRKERPFSREEFARRRTVEVGDSSWLAIATAEDTVLSKLEWARKGGGSERQLSDVRGILEVKGGDLDLDYVERWARELGVLDLWQAVTRRSTRIRRRVNAPRARVYRALVEARAVATWMVPTGMTSHVHAFDAREGGTFRISLTYDTPAGTGKTTANTDTCHGRFVKLVPNEQMVEVVEFETSDSAMQGEMTITITLADAEGGTEVLAVHDGLPPGLSEAANEEGWRSSLDRLAALVQEG